MISIKKPTIHIVIGGFLFVGILVLGYVSLQPNIGNVNNGERVPCESVVNDRKFSSGDYYTGPLIDAHLHMPVASWIVSTVGVASGFYDVPQYDDELTIDDIVCLFEREGIDMAFGFNLAPQWNIRKSIRTVKEIEKRHPEKFAHFYMPTQLPLLNPTPKQVESILSQNPGLFQGYGEVKFDFHEIENQGILDKQYLKAYELAEKYGLVIMMHPASHHKDEVTHLLEKHKNVNFLFHSGSIADWITDLMRDYDNAYFSLDGNFNYIGGWDEEHASGALTKEEYLSYMRSNFNSALKDELNQWKEAIETYPDQFLWGTDRWYRWQFDQEVGDTVQEFSRSFIGQLDKSVQEKFAYKNALRILKGGEDK